MRQEVQRQRFDVLRALAQRRQLDDDGIEAVKQILAESPALDLGVQVGVGRRQDTRVDVTEPRRADALHLASLQHAQQLGLQPHRHVRDLVEEERAFVGQLEASDAIEACISECALHVAEQLALGDTFREAARVHRHQRLAAPLRERVQPRRDDFFAGAVLAGDEHSGIGRRDPLDGLAHFHDGG